MTDSMNDGSAGLGNDVVMLLMLTLPILLLAVIAIVAIAARRGLLGDPRRTVNISAPLVTVASALSVGAAGIHFAVVEPHLSEDPPAAVFFVVLAWFQVIWAMAYLVRPNDPLRLVAIAVNIATIAIWIASRTTGLPIGPQPWTPETLGIADLMSSSFEIVLVGLLAGTVLPSLARRLSVSSVSLEKAYVMGSFSVVTVVTLTAMALLGSPAG